MLLFGVQALLAAALEYGNRLGAERRDAGAGPEFLSFRNNYLVVYSLMMGERRQQGEGPARPGCMLAARVAVRRGRRPVGRLTAP